MDSKKRQTAVDSAGFRKTPMALGPFGTLLQHYSLIWVLAWSELKSTYARSVFGLVWLVLFPVFYVIVFVGVRILLFDRSATSSDWLGAALGIGDLPMLALQIFMGFVIFWSASEIINRSPTAVRSNANLLAGSVFPVEVLPWVTIVTAMVNLTVRLGIFLIAYLAIVHGFQATAFLLPLVITPLLLLLIGLGYLFAAIGVHFQDLDYILTALTTGLLLLSAVIFPISELPPDVQPYLLLNPIALTIEQARQVVILGHMPAWEYLAVLTLVGVAAAWCGFAVYRRLKNGFADVL